MGLFDSVFELVSDTASIVTAPIEVAIDLISVPVKEVSDVTKELVNDIKSLKD